MITNEMKHLPKLYRQRCDSKHQTPNFTASYKRPGDSNMQNKKNERENR